MLERRRGDGEASESESDVVFGDESVDVCAIFDDEGVEGSPAGTIGLLGDAWEPAVDWRASDRVVSGELGTAIDDAR